MEVALQAKDNPNDGDSRFRGELLAHGYSEMVSSSAWFETLMALLSISSLIGFLVRVAVLRRMPPPLGRSRDKISILTFRISVLTLMTLIGRYKAWRYAG